MKNNLKKILSIDGIDFYKFEPTFFKQYLNCYSKNDTPPYVDRIVHKIRMFILKISGNYRIYYMFKNEIVIGHYVVSNGGNRVKASNSNDIVIGPIWVSPKFRGQGYGTTGLLAILNLIEKNYINAYEYIEKNNFASIKIVNKSGYQLIGRAKEKGLLKNIVEDENGELLLFR